MINLITNFFLFIVKVETNDVFKYLSIFETLQNQNKISLIIIMRKNFGRFWNVLENKHPKSLNELIDLFISNSNELFDNSNNLFDKEELYTYKKKTLYDSVNKLIKYSDNIDLFKFIKKFYNLENDGYINFIEQDDKNSSFNFKHDICMYWLRLTNVNKNKLLTMIDEYFNNLNEYEKNIIFNRVKNRRTNFDLNIDIFDESKHNVIRIKNLSQYENLIELIEKKESKKGVIIDTLIINVNLEDKQIEIPFQITNVKFINCNISNLDHIHNGVRIIDCVSNDVIQLDNLPFGLKILLCGNNNIKQLNNLPNSLEYLDCHTNNIETFKLLPNSLKYLNCNFNNIIDLGNLPPNLIYLNCDKNKIVSIDNLPPNLIYLSCCKNKIKSWNKLPETLIEFNCKSNLINEVKNLPLGLTRLNISNNYIKLIYSLNSNIEELNLSENNITIYDLPNMIEKIQLTRNVVLCDKIKTFYDNYVNK